MPFRAGQYLNQLFFGHSRRLVRTADTGNSDLTSRQRTVELFLREVEHNPAISRELWTITSMANIAAWA